MRVKRGTSENYAKTLVVNWDCPSKHLVTLGLEEPRRTTKENSRVVIQFRAKQRVLES